MLDEIRIEIDALRNDTHSSFIARELVQLLQDSKSAIKLLIQGDVNFLYVHKPEFKDVSNNIDY
jgi:hypothetical protein